MQRIFEFQLFLQLTEDKKVILIEIFFLRNIVKQGEKMFPRSIKFLFSLNIPSNESKY